ncbi:MAG: hypothetical protein AAFY75_04135 [Pseudomonadota bacterium]
MTDRSASVVNIFVGGESPDQSMQVANLPSPDKKADKTVSQGVPFDPHKAAAHAPELWASLLAQQYRGPLAVVRIAARFGVTERHAQRWLNAAGGECKISHVRLAVQDDPATALPILFNIAAE